MANLDGRVVDCEKRSCGDASVLVSMHSTDNRSINQAKDHPPTMSKTICEAYSQWCCERRACCRSGAHLHVTRMKLLDEPVDILERPEWLMNSLVVRDIVQIVFERGLADG